MPRYTISDEAPSVKVDLQMMGDAVVVVISGGAENDSQRVLCLNADGTYNLEPLNEKKARRLGIQLQGAGVMRERRSAKPPAELEPLPVDFSFMDRSDLLAFLRTNDFNLPNLQLLSDDDLRSLCLRSVEVKRERLLHSSDAFADMDRFELITYLSHHGANETRVALNNNRGLKDLAREFNLGYLQTNDPTWGVA